MSEAGIENGCAGFMWRTGHPTLGRAQFIPATMSTTRVCKNLLAVTGHSII
jgi:hypothetical protein